MSIDSGTARVGVEVEGSIATVTLNAPEKHNALSVEISLGLADAFSKLDAEDAIRCVVVRGAGGRAFSAGADIGEFAQWRAGKARGRTYARILGGAYDAVLGCRHPTVALVEGLCVGGGFGVAGMCDLRVCGVSSRFGVPVKRLGLVETPRELAPLVAKFGTNVLLEVLLLGELIDAPDALRLGLVTRMVADAEVEAEAMRIARSIAEGAPLVARWHKRFVHRLLDPAPITDAEEDEGYECYDTEDFQRGYRAFLAKEPPEFVGR